MTLPTVAIVGLGQIGGSFAAALTKRGLARVIGVTRRPATAKRALEMGILEEAGTDLDEIGAAEVVVLATPVRTLLRQIPEVASRVRRDAILTDVGSTKAEILDALRASRSRATVVAGPSHGGQRTGGTRRLRRQGVRNRPWVLIGDRLKATRLES
jgi:prephenate dehydrogenase